MTRKRLLLVDDDINNLNVLCEHFQRSNIDAESTTSTRDAIEKISQHSYDAILTEIDGEKIDGYKCLQIDSETTQPPAVLFLTQKSDVWHRQKSLKLGAKDYIVKPIHAKEIVARTEMILGRLQKHDKSNEKFIGRLENLSLVQLIETFGIQKKSGTLTLNQNEKEGKVYFKEGVAISAGLEALAAEDAIYKMMSWQKGHFAMDFHPVDKTDEIVIGNLGLLLQGAKIMDERQKLLQQLPPLDAVLATTGNFKKIVSSQEMEPELENFVNLFDGQQTLQTILQKSDMDEINLLKRIVKLYDLGFLYVPDDSTVGSQPSIYPPEDHISELDEKAPTEDNIPSYPSSDNDNLSEMDNDPFSVFRQTADKDLDQTEDEKNDLTFPVEKSPHPADELLKVPEPHEEESPPLTKTKPKQSKSGPKSQNHVLVLSNQSRLCKQLIDTLTRSSQKPSPAGNSTTLSFGVMNIKNKYSLNLVGVPLEEEFDTIIDRFENALIGILVLIDSETVNAGYLRYLLNALRAKRLYPIQLVIKTHSPSTYPDVNQLRQQYNLAENENIMIIDHLEKQQSNQLLKALIKSYSRTRHN